jgi:hypothetical protein
MLSPRIALVRFPTKRAPLNAGAGGNGTPAKAVNSDGVWFRKFPARSANHTQYSLATRVIGHAGQSRSPPSFDKHHSGTTSFPTPSKLCLYQSACRVAQKNTQTSTKSLQPDPTTPWVFVVQQIWHCRQYRPIPIPSSLAISNPVAYDRFAVPRASNFLSYSSLSTTDFTTMLKCGTSWLRFTTLNTKYSFPLFCLLTPGHGCAGSHDGVSLNSADC